MDGSSTIIALSSGALPSGVAVIRLSGPAAARVLGAVAGPLPAPRSLALRTIRRRDGDLIDSGLVAYFPAPHSFTGEDCGELHVHGSRAVVSALLDELTGFEDVHLAEPGAFTRRAFEAGKLDLTSVEGLSDLIAAETENQRRLAVARASGQLRDRVSDWRMALLELRAEIEAQLDFSDEDDVPEGMSSAFWTKLSALRGELEAALGGIKAGQIMREGFRVVLAGPPNAGKSSLLNALTQSDVAIVTEEPGTTRDVREVQIDIDGQLVILCDVAGLRDTDSLAESEGVRRARAAMQEADLVLWLEAPDVAPLDGLAEEVGPILRVATKTDIGAVRLDADLEVSAVSGEGMQVLREEIGRRAGKAAQGEAVLISHRRDAKAIASALSAIGEEGLEGLSEELVAERLRQASDSLGRLTGEIGAEAVLDRLFAGFCIGK